MIGSKLVLLWLAAVASLFGKTHGKLSTNTALYQAESKRYNAGRALRKDELYLLDVTKKPTVKSTPKPSTGRNSDQLLSREVTKRPTNKPSPRPSVTTVEVHQPLGQSGITFDKLFDLLNEHDRHDELVFMTVTREPTDKPTKKPTEEPTTVRDDV